MCVCVCVAKLSGFKINTVYLKSQNKKKPIFLKDLNSTYNTCYSTYKFINYLCKNNYLFMYISNI